jgi:hypothetical protein
MFCLFSHSIKARAELNSNVKIRNPEEKLGALNRGGILRTSRESFSCLACTSLNLENNEKSILNFMKCATSNEQKLKSKRGETFLHFGDLSFEWNCLGFVPPQPRGNMNYDASLAPPKKNLA